MLILSLGGRSAIVSAATGEDLFSKDWDARTRVHEYGGGAAIVHNNVLYFSNFADNRVYKAELGKEPIPITEGMPFVVCELLLATQECMGIRKLREQSPPLCRLHRTPRLQQSHRGVWGRPY